MLETKEPLVDNELRRGEVAERIAEVLAQLADAENLPAGRVLAVDAPWGSGKTWIAERLQGLLENRHQRCRAVYINAFEFDFHHDPFAVLASAVIDTAGGAVSRGLKDAAADVLRVAAPAIASGVAKSLVKTVAGDEALAAIEAAATGVTDVAVNKLLDSFSETKRTAQAFRERLREVAQSEPGPFVIIVDELDRCRPTFALEMLERIKHLFDVPNVVFALFVHGDALNSAIQSTYGQGIDPVAYLRKFVSIRMSLPVTIGSFNPNGNPSEFAEAFLLAKYPQLRGNLQMWRMFGESLVALAPIFSLTLRDLQAIMTLAQVLMREVGQRPHEAAYALVLRVVDPLAMKALQTGSAEAWERELKRFAASPSSARVVEHLRAAMSDALAVMRSPDYQSPDPGRRFRLLSAFQELGAANIGM